MKKLFLLFLCIMSVCTYSTAQINVLQSRIKVDASSETDKVAAAIFQEYVEKISGTKLPVLNDSETPLKGDIIIGLANNLPVDFLKSDGFSITTEDGYIRVLSAKEGNGAIYGVSEILENYLGVRYWAPEACDIPTSKSLSIPNGLNIIENPAFEYRQTNSFAEQDSMYRNFRRLKLPKEVFAANLWVHTFNTLIPASVYGEAHPEYYALINGERRPGTQSQLCLTNDDVFELMSHKVDSIFKSDPSKTLISISQNDGNMTNCSCDKCKAIDDKEEALSGSIITFLNRLATRFPEKEFSTLAYTYSVKPPKNIKPLPNVNIMLCDIDCMRELPLTGTKSGREFVGYMERWNKISDNIFVWDYGINFDNCVSPFPNFHILQDNIQLFHKNNVTKLFEQVNGSKGVDFAELRGYMITKLMWNPYQDSDSLMREFVWGYYGDAAQPIYDYLKLQQGGLVSTGINLWIYDSPVTHKNGFLNQNMITEYKRLFDKAEKAVKDNSVLLDRVRLSRLPLQYAELEIARTLIGQNSAELREKVKLFKERASYFDVKSLNERGNAPEAYCDEYLVRYLPSKVENLAAGAKIVFDVKPSGRYGVGAEKVLTDGLYGGTSFVESWVGWEGIDGIFTIDLGEVKEFTSIESDYLHQLGQWVFLPKGVKYEISNDGKTFTSFGKCYKPENRSNSVLFDKFEVKKSIAVKARYIKVSIENIKKCPSWHYGIGHNAWMFLDEVTVTK